MCPGSHCIAAENFAEASKKSGNVTYVHRVSSNSLKRR